MKKLVAAGLGVAVLGGLYTMPKMVESTIPSVYYVTPTTQTYTNTVNCSGTIQAQTVHAVYVEAPIVAGQVLAEIGDVVREGEVLVRVDREKTNLFSGQTLDFSDTSAALDQSSSIDWSGLASLYGLSAVVSGGGVDYGQIEDILESGVNTAMDTVADTVDSAVVDEITAPISGIVTDVSIYEGVPVGAGKAILTIADTGSYKVMATVGEADVSKVKAGDRATVRGVAFQKAYTGVVTKVYPTARKALSGTSTETVVDVEIHLEDGDDRLKSGFSAKVEIAGGEDYRMLTVPYEAVRQDDNNDEYVYVYQNGRLQKALVTTGQELTNEVQVLGGLDEESIVVYNPGSALREGSMIHIKGRADDH